MFRLSLSHFYILFFFFVSLQSFTSHLRRHCETKFLSRHLEQISVLERILISAPQTVEKSNVTRYRNGESSRCQQFTHVSFKFVTLLMAFGGITFPLYVTHICTDEHLTISELESFPTGN